MKRFNVNYNVYVRLTEIGLDELRRQHEEFKKSWSGAGEFATPNVNEKGYSRFQMHDLMNKFGHMMVNGFRVPFETDILFQDYDLDDAEE